MIEQSKQKTLKDWLVSYKDQISVALPKHVNADSMIRSIMTEMSRNPKLRECTPASFMGCVLILSQLGITPGPLGFGYLIPYKNSKLSRDSGSDIYECQFILGYRGFLELARRSGNIKRISAREVYSNDHFDYSFGIIEKCDHRPADGDRGDFKGAYAVAEFSDGCHHFEYMTAEEINKIRDKSSNYSCWARNGKKGEGPIWETDYGEMAKKTVIRRMAKYLPLSIEAHNAIALDESADYGSQNISYIISEDVNDTHDTMRSKADQIADKIAETIS